jgi:hypothetical protein
MLSGERNRLKHRMLAAVARIRLTKNSDEHRWNILQTVFRFRLVEESSVLFQLIRYLVNDETAARFERIVRLLQQVPFLPDLENAKRNPGEDVIATADASARQFIREGSGIGMENLDTGIAGKLPAQIARKRGIEFEEQKFRIRAHAAGDLARMDAFARSVFGDDPGTSEIDLVGDAFDQGLGAGNNGSDLKRPLQKSLKEQNAHEVANFYRRLRLVQSRLPRHKSALPTSFEHLV